mmetsp:Transcript_10674/g.24290  ORF Transcript_10674/g.24290 Transcript_10674/m.24290 type:complete len:218 (-) Transcript_10674:395-1048(-)
MYFFKPRSLRRSPRHCTIPSLAAIRSLFFVRVTFAPGRQRVPSCFTRTVPTFTAFPCPPFSCTPRCVGFCLRPCCLVADAAFLCAFMMMEALHVALPEDISVEPPANREGMLLLEAEDMPGWDKLKETAWRLDLAKDIHPADAAGKYGLSLWDSSPLYMFRNFPSMMPSSHSLYSSIPSFCNCNCCLKRFVHPIFLAFLRKCNHERYSTPPAGAFVT